MSKEKKICEKCKKAFYCDEHHILPKGLFREAETDNLCTNCHDEFHRVLGHKYLRKKHKQSMEFYLKKYFKWLYTSCIIAVIFITSYLLVNYLVT